MILVWNANSAKDVCPNYCKCHCKLPRPDTLTKRWREWWKNEHDGIALCICSKGEFTFTRVGDILDWSVLNVIMVWRHQWWASHRKRLAGEHFAARRRQKRVALGLLWREGKLGFWSFFTRFMISHFRLPFPLVSEWPASHDVRTRAFGVPFDLMFLSLVRIYLCVWISADIAGFDFLPCQLSITSR